MCGLLGEFVYGKACLTAFETFDALLALSKQRGPDSNAIMGGSYYQLGFNRLAVLDLSAKGNQPQYSPSQRYCVVFNGELYNYKRLASEHGLHNLSSHCDTEVLVHLLDVLGIEATMRSLDGMFAIAIVDTVNRTLYLSRDFAGIKPLFYGFGKQGVVAASQFDQIFKHGFFKSDLRLRPSVVKGYFGLGYMQAPDTIYENIFQVRPGELLSVSATGDVTSTLLTQFEGVGTTTIPEAAEVSEFDRVLSNVVSEQLVSDVPLAAFLSGGIDSPLVCALAKKHKPDLNTFTVAVASEQHDESEAANDYAAFLGTEHTTAPMDASVMLGHLDAHFQSLTEPFGDYSSLPTYMITKLAKGEHTVMLSGDGGDELFFGYPRMQDVIRKRGWFSIPFMIRKPLVRLGIKLKLWHSWSPYLYRSLDAFVMSKHCHISLKRLEALMPNTPFAEALERLYKVPNGMSDGALLHWLRYNEFYGHMQRVLVKVDRMSMANSLEVRVPFLAKDSIAYAWGLVPEQRHGRFNLKGLLKTVLSLHYPKRLIQTEKKGFSVPMYDWLHDVLKPDVMRVVFEHAFYGAAVLDVAAFRQYVRDFFDGKHKEFWGVWHVYAWQKWAISSGLV
ncbi:asparagine synthase (glutamine-hydrolyzing) [Snuella lapsa]|uniref:asparagine synthase (glutamine-hydrolyzing) n=1 Tax=Snuella lapsa TaxID=870481 RepID=A0ABP6XWL7_9FLAO